MVSSLKLRVDNGNDFDNPILYRSTIKALQYINITKPDISLLMNNVSNAWVSPKRYIEVLWKEYWGICMVS